MASSTPSEPDGSRASCPGPVAGDFPDDRAAGGGHRLERALWTIGGVVVLVFAWHRAAAGQPQYMMPGPEDTVRALARIVGRPDFWPMLGLTLGRGMTGLVLAVAGGVALGCAIGRWERVGWFFQPVLQVLLSTPAIIFVILAMVWFGANGTVAVFVVAIVTTPVLTAATAQAVRGIDVDLLEMARLFGLRRWTILRRVTFPMVAPPVLAATTVALGQSIRITVMAELLATATGVGGAIRLAQINIETPDIFAYAVVMTAITFALEALLVSPLRKRTQAHLRGRVS